MTARRPDREMARERAASPVVPSGHPAIAGAGAAGSAAPTEGQVFHGSSLAARYASFVKLPHTLFALPFAGVGVVLASYVRPQGITLRAVLWIALAFTAARFAAMGFNRIADRRIDAMNPRTARRELPTGQLTLAQAWASVVVASAVFVFAAWRLAPICAYLAPIALAWVFLYSYTKRFTMWGPHVLGIALGMAPVGAYLAVTGQWSDPWWALPLLAASVMFWAGGFDVLYALQDVDFDVEHGLYSIPARLGVRSATVLSRLSHAASVLCFALLWLLHAFPVGWLYAAAVGMAAVILHFEHAMVRRQDPTRLDLKTIDRAFFHANVGISIGFFLLTLLDRLLLA